MLTGLTSGFVLNQSDHQHRLIRISEIPHAFYGLKMVLSANGDGPDQTARTDQDNRSLAYVTGYNFSRIGHIYTYLKKLLK